MKNKKLFAILTLLCFLFTLMPVAAFAVPTVYAEVNEDSEIVAVGDEIVLDITNGDGAEYYLFAMKDDSVYKNLGITTGSAINGKITIANGIAKAGTYDIYVVDQTDYTKAIVAKYDAADLTRDEAAARLIKEAAVVMLDNTVIVKAATTEYTVSVEKATNGVLKDGVLTLAADSGYTESDVYVKLVDITGAVVGATLKVSTNSSAVEVSDEEVVTNAAGLAKFTVSSSIAGSFKVYVEYGTKADCELTVTSTGLAAANITTITEPDAPVALDSEVDCDDVDVYFSVTDANGNSASLINDKNYRVVVTEKPATSKISADAIYLKSTANGWGFDSTETFDEEGTYSFKVILNNGNYATATVVVKEFQTPVELKVVYPTPAVELNGVTAPTKVVFVDANGVEKAATGVELSATGYAIADFNSVTGEITVKDNEKYVSSKITVLAVSTKYNLTDTVELTVANEAAAVKYAKTTADVAVNNTLVANIVDIDGNKVALNAAAKDNNATIQYIVLDKPEGSKVAVTTKTMADLVTKGQFKVSFTASAIGEYKLQTVVRYEQAGGTDEPVVKYYSGIETITVGNTGVEDVVVMSINSNEIVVNSEIKTIDAAPIVENNRTFVPFRALAEAFGATVAYDEATQAVTAELNGTTVVMTIGSAAYTVNGVEKTADVAPFINGSRTMVPVRFVAEAFGITVTPTYDDNGATADILFAK